MQTFKQYLSEMRNDIIWLYASAPTYDWVFMKDKVPEMIRANINGKDMRGIGFVRERLSDFRSNPMYDSHLDKDLVYFLLAIDNDKLKRDNYKTFPVNIHGQNSEFLPGELNEIHKYIAEIYVGYSLVGKDRKEIKEFLRNKDGYIANLGVYKYSRLHKIDVEWLKQ